MFSAKITFNFELMYLVRLEKLEWRKKDKYLLRILSVACNKSLTEKWLKKEVPGVDKWIDLVYIIHIMERMTFNLRCQKDTFIENRAK